MPIVGHTHQNPPEDGPMQEHTDIPYVENSATLKWHSFDLYIPKGAKPSAPLLCWVHGGAWRSEDKSDHASLARRLANKTLSPVALPNYRLTTPATKLQHPAHAEDLLAFLHFILDWEGPPGHPNLYDPTRIYAVGHSCTGHMLSSIYLAPPTPVPAFPSLIPSARLLKATRGIIMGEGIYDIDRLLASFPTYREWFIANAFGDLPSFETFNTAEYVSREDGKHIRWLLLHSTGDQLVDMIQSRSMADSLEKGYPGNVERYWELTKDHNDILTEDAYVVKISNFMERTEASKEAGLGV